MRQQLISWLIEDIAPEIRRSRNPSGEIIKFANANNLSPALVQSLGQLYNTAKTLAFLEKRASDRGDSFPILDVDKLVADYLEVTPKLAALPDPVNAPDFTEDQGLNDLPSCFAGILSAEGEAELPLKAASAPSEIETWITETHQRQALELNLQLKAETEMLITKQADVIGRLLRENPHYTFERLEADSRYFNGEHPHLLNTLDKLAGYLDECELRVPVKRASAPSARKLLNDFEERMVNEVSRLDDLFFQREAAQLIVKESTAADTPRGQEILSRYRMAELEDDIKDQPAEEAGSLPESRTSAGTEPLKANAPATPKATGGARGADSDGGGGPSKAPSSKGYFEGLSEKFDQLIGGGDRRLSGLMAGLGGDGSGQRMMDDGARDVRHLALLQNLLTTDDILSEADPDQVVALYGTIRENAPELAGDINVMRVLLRSAIQHDGIAPFDLKGIIETEQAKQKVDAGRRDSGRPNPGRPPIPSIPA